MNLPRWAVKRPVSVAVLTLACLLFGLLSAARLSLELFPRMTLPYVTIATFYPNADPLTVETEITAPVEAAVALVSGVRHVESLSMEHASLVVVELDWGTALGQALEDIRSALSAATLAFPSGVQSPVVLPVNPSQLPLMLISLQGEDALALTDLALEVIRPRLEQVEGVGQVAVLGGLRREIQVLYHSQRLRENGVTPARLHQMLALQNVTVPAGAVESDGVRYQTRVGVPLQTVEDLAQLVVAERKDGPEIIGLGALVPQVLTLQDLADVQEVQRPRGGLVRVNGEPAVVLRVSARSGANAVRTVAGVKEALAALQSAYPQVQARVLYDQATFITQSLGNLARYGSLGALFAALVLYLFIRSWRAILVIAVAIPLSVLITLAGMHFSSMSLNLMTLGGLSVATGMLVDNAIVVLENIYRHRRQGYASAEAAEKGSQQVAAAITASTLTTVAVFLPILFVDGFAGQLFRELGLTVSIALAASLLVAVVVVPALGSRLLAGDAPEFHRERGLVHRFLGRYNHVLRWALGRPWTVLLLACAAFLATLPLWGRLGAEFLPQTRAATLHLRALAPPGTPVDETARRVAAFERQLLQIPEVQDVFVQLGSPETDDILALLAENRPNSAQISVTLRRGRGGRTSREILDLIRALDEADPSLEIFLVPDSHYGPLGDVLSNELIVRIAGPDLTELQRLAHQLKGILDDLGAFPEVHVSPRAGEPELVLDVNRSRALMGGLTTGQVGLALRHALSGYTASTLRLDGRSVPVVVRPHPQELGDLDSLMDFRITSPVELPTLNTGPVRVSSIAQPLFQEGPAAVYRSDGQRMVEVRALLAGTDLDKAREIMVRSLDELQIPPAYSVTLGGVQQLVSETFRDLAWALALSLVVVYLLMAALFESWRVPLLMMTTVPLAGVGAVVALYLGGQKLGATALIGLIMLGGLVVNNGIVLLDYIGQLRTQGKPLEQAVLEGATARLRPVLMTAVTTLLGLLPLIVASGEGTEMEKPLALAVAGGLFSSTLLTLLVLPCLYTLVERRGRASSEPSLSSSHHGKAPAALGMGLILISLSLTAPAISWAASSVNADRDEVVLAADLTVDNRGGQSLYLLKADWNTAFNATKLRLHLTNGLDPSSESGQTLRLGVHADWFRPIHLVGYQRISGDFLLGRLGNDEARSLSLESRNVLGNVEMRFEMSYVEGRWGSLAWGSAGQPVFLPLQWDGLYQLRGEFRQGQSSNLVWVRNATWSKPFANGRDEHPGALTLTSGSEVRSGPAWFIGKAGVVLEGHELRPVLEAGARVRTSEGSQLDIGLASSTGYSPSPSLDVRYRIQGERASFTSMLRAEYTSEGQLKPSFYLGVEPGAGRGSWEFLMQEDSSFRLGWTTSF